MVERKNAIRGQEKANGMGESKYSRKCEEIQVPWVPTYLRKK